MNREILNNAFLTGFIKAAALTISQPQIKMPVIAPIAPIKRPVISVPGKTTYPNISKPNINKPAISQPTLSMPSGPGLVSNPSSY